MKVVLFTLSEYGQSNTILALAEEFLARPDVDVHLCSYPIVKKRVEAIRTPSSGITFHPLQGQTYLEAGLLLGVVPETLAAPPTLKSTKLFHNLDAIITMYGEKAYVGLVDECKAVIKLLDPDIIVIDVLCSFAIDACRVLDKRYVLNSPLQAMDMVRLQQPGLKGLWYYPALFSGIPFPVPWRLFLTNIGISLNMIAAFMTNPRMKALPKFRKEAGFKGVHPVLEVYHPDIDIVCPAIAETDYPCYCPPNIHRFGTITLDDVPLQQADPDLKAWLDRRKTLVISLGTHAAYTEDMVRSFFCGLLDKLPADMQVLWKLKEKSKFDHVIEEMLGSMMKEQDRFKILDWIVANPKAIMEHPNVACYVHHGGANSFFECCLAGVPQIIIAMWYDLYDNAVKAEYRGIGVYGNKTCAPGVDAAEFGDALARVLDPGPEAAQFKANALRISELCKKAGGKKAAVDFILGTVGQGKVRIHPA